MDTEPSESASIVSPFATGGGGPEFEKLVGAYYLTLLLVEGVPFGLPTGVAKLIQWQRAFQGEPLDDLIVHADQLAGEAKLALQVKRDLTFGDANSVFQAVVGAAWRTFVNSLTPGRDRVGFVLGLYSKRIDEHFQAALQWARTSSSSADFLLRIDTAGLASRTQRTFVALMRAALDTAADRSITDDELWQFLRALGLLRFDFMNDPSHDRATAVHVLRGILPTADRYQADHLFNQLVIYAGDASRTAGSFSPDTLRERLASDGFILDPPIGAREDLRRLHDHCQMIVNDIPGRIGPVELGRVDILTSALELMKENRFVEIVGPPGVGKSNVLKAVIETERTRGPLLVLSHDRITAPGWDAFAAGLRLDRRLPELLTALGAHPEPCILIDGADRITEAGPRRVVNDLLRAVVAQDAGSSGMTRWRLVITARDGSLPMLHSWLDLTGLGSPALLEVPQLTDVELVHVVTHVPRLAPLIDDERLAPILRNALFLSLIADPRITGQGGAMHPPVATEIEVSSAWWERIVGSGGALGQARRSCLLAIGERALYAPGRRFAPEGVEASVVISLEGDHILMRDPGRDVFRFGHDLLEEWVLYRALDHQRDALPGLLVDIGQPIGLMRATQLLGCFLLERGEVSSWESLLRAMEADPRLAPRWRQTLLAAPLLSTLTGKLLDQVEPLLLEEDGRRLGELLTVLRTSEVRSNPFLAAAAKVIAHEPLEQEALLFAVPLPLWRVWCPVLEWVLARADALPERLRPEIVHAMLVWQRVAPVGFPLRDQIGRLALRWIREVEAPLA